MDRCRSGFPVILITALLTTLAGCAGKSSNTVGNDTVQSVTLSPDGNISVDLGSANQAFSATARNGIGQVIPANIKFATGCAPNINPCAPITVANSGQLCAGTWDSLTNPRFCTPGVVGVAQVTAVVGGISSSPATIYVHQHIDNMTVTPTSPPPANCFSLGDPDPLKRTAVFQATAFSNGVDITNSVGPIGFSTTNGGVLTVNTNNQLPTNEVQVTARTPGITNLFASVGGVTSNPYLYTTCLVSSVLLQIENGEGDVINFTNGGSQAIQATVLDTLGNAVSNPPLTWGSTNPEIATVTATSNNGKNTVTAKANLGGADVFAACEPPACNIGVLPALPVYSSGGNVPPPNGKPGYGALAVNVTNSKPPTYTTWATTTGCGNAPNCSSVIFSAKAGNTPVGIATSLPFTPNSMRITPDGGQAYLGSDFGLMIVGGLGGVPTVSTASQQTSPCNVALCGQVLAISPDGKRVVVGDTHTNPNQVYIFSSGSSPVDLIIPGATAATFSPDGLKLFVLTNSSTMYVYSTLDALAAVPVAGPPTDVTFSADGSFAYVAGAEGASFAGFATCNAANLGSIGTSAPVRIFSSPDIQPNGSKLVQQVVAVDPPNVDIFSAQFTQNALQGGVFECNPPTVTLSSVGSFNLGQGDFTPLFMELAGNGSQVIVVAKDIPAVLVFDVNSHTTTPIPLVNNPSPLAAAASTDGNQIFVASCDAVHPQSQFTCGSIHIVNLLAGGDIQQAVYTNLSTHDSLCIGLDPNGPPCLPDLIAVRPQ